jgi:hypothetical protein
MILVSFFLQSKGANVNRINANKKLNGLDRLDKLIESFIEWDKVIDILGKMDDNELSKISRGGDNEWLTFKFANNLKGISNINDAVKVLQSQYYNEIKKYYYELINKIHRDSNTSENIEEIIGRYEKLKVLIEKLCSKTSYEKFLEVECQKMKGRLDDNIIRNSILINDWISKYKKIKTLYYENRSSMDYIKNIEDYIKNLEDLKVDYSLLPPKKKGEIIYYFKFHFDNKGGFDFNVENFVDWIDNTINNQEKLKNKDYKVRNTDNTGIDVVKDYLNYKSTITQEDSEKSFSELVNDIGVDRVENEDFPTILSNYVIDKELLEQRKDILDKIKKINSKITNINDKREQLKNADRLDWENEGKTKLPQYENEKENLEEQLRIIDPIKALFDSDNGWGNNYINCGPNDKYSNYLAQYYGTPKKAHKALLNKHQIDAVNNPNTQIGKRDCENYNLEKLTTEIDRVSNREDIKNELTNNFTDLVDIIFKMIIDKGILTNTPLQKYKSYINMIKIYSQGENQKEMLTQLIYDLNQLKNVVESYDILTDTAESPQTSSEEDTQEEGTKLLSKTGLQSLLNKISKNSWDREEIKDYFVKVREHNNVAYEKSFEKECNEIQYFKKVTGGDRPRIIDENNNNTHLVNYILSANTENNYISTEKIVDTIFSEVKDLLKDENAIKNRLKKYDLEVLSNITLTQKNGGGTFELSPSKERYIEVKDTKPKDYHFSEFFGVYKSTKSEVYKRMKNLIDNEETNENENFERYNKFVEGLVEKLISGEGEKIIDIIKSKLQGVFFEKYEFCPIDNIKFSWSTVGQGKEGGREKRVTIRIEPIDYDKIYVWKEGNSNCGRFKFDGCEENPGCSQNESTDRLDEIIENFFDTGKFVI